MLHTRPKSWTDVRQVHRFGWQQCLLVRQERVTDAEVMHLQDLMNRMGSGNLYSEGGFPDLDADVRSNYIMNTTLMGVEKADSILLIGSNPRIEAPVFNAR